MDIQEYLLTEGTFESYQINYMLKKTPIALSLSIVPLSIPLFIPPIIKPTNLSTPEPFASSLSSTPAQSAPASVNTSLVFPSTIPFILASTQLSGMGLTPVVKPIINLPSTINLLTTMTTTSTGYDRKLPNLAKTYTDKAKHNGQNNSSTFKLANLWKNALSSLLKNFQMGSTSKRGPCQAMK